MPEPKSVWLDALEWMTAFGKTLGHEWPPELPDPATPGFWIRAVELEMQTRDRLSALLRSRVTRGELSGLTAIETWLTWRRIEWAAQLAMAKAHQRVEPDAALAVVLDWLLVGSWETDGMRGLLNHAARGGTPHPENPDGLSPL